MSASVSVIIPAWRSAATIARALASVATQSVKPLEVIVIDDGSDDGTFEAAEACRPRMNGVDLKVIRQDNKGAGAARNAGVHVAKGDWLAFLDADDEWLPQKIERSLAHADGASLIAHDYVELRSGQETYIDCTRHLNAAKDPFKALMLRGFIPSIGVLARRADVLAVGGFEESLPAAQDYDLWLKLLSRPSARLVMFPEALSRYTVNGTGITSKVDQRRRCSLAVLYRHLPVLAERGSALTVALQRVLIVHYEALMAHQARGHYLKALFGLLYLPGDMMRPFLALWGAPIVLLHGFAVTLAYLWFSKGYYEGKLAVFGQYLLHKVGL